MPQEDKPMSNQKNPNKNTLVRRKAIQTAIQPCIEAALKSLTDLDLSREEDARRFVRALVHVGAAHVLDAGGDPATVFTACVEALSKEVEARTLALPTPEMLPAPTLFLQPPANA